MNQFIKTRLQFKKNQFQKFKVQASQDWIMDKAAEQHIKSGNPGNGRNKGNVYKRDNLIALNNSIDQIKTEIDNQTSLIQSSGLSLGEMKLKLDQRKLQLNDDKTQLDKEMKRILKIRSELDILSKKHLDHVEQYKRYQNDHRQNESTLKSLKNDLAEQERARSKESGQQIIANQKARLDSFAAKHALVLAKERVSPMNQYNGSEQVGERKVDSNRGRNRNCDRAAIQDVCSVCLEDLNPLDRIVGIVETECGHPFHSMCLLPWITQKLEEGHVPECPMCRAAIDPTSRGKVERMYNKVIEERKKTKDERKRIKKLNKKKKKGNDDDESRMNTTVNSLESPKLLALQTKVEPETKQMSLKEEDKEQLLAKKQERKAAKRRRRDIEIEEKKRARMELKKQHKEKEEEEKKKQRMVQQEEKREKKAALKQQLKEKQLRKERLKKERLEEERLKHDQQLKEQQLKEQQLKKQQLKENIIERVEAAANKFTIKYGDGDVYDGQMEGGNRHGYGTYTYADGSKYVGEWKNDAIKIFIRLCIKQPTTLPSWLNKKSSK